MQNNLLSEAILELFRQAQIHPTIVSGRMCGNFVAYLLTGDRKTAKLLWNNTLRARVFCTCMDMLLIREIDNYLDSI